MVLDLLNDGAKRLVLITCLPFIDGVFATLLVTGAVETFSNVLVIAVTIFTGAGALAVLYTEAETRKEAIRLAAQASVAIVLGALAVALIAPVYAELFYAGRLSIVAGIMVLVISAKMAGLPYADRFSTPGILLTGLVLSVQNPGAITFSTVYVVPALATAGMAVLALHAAALVNPARISLRYMRLGGALVLALIALSLFGLNIPSELALGVFGTSMAAALRL